MQILKIAFKLIILLLSVFSLNLSLLQAQVADAKDAGFIAVIDMEMEILPGSAEFLQTSIDRASLSGAKLLIVKLDTPGGLLISAQDMVKSIFDAPIPIIIYVGPSGATASSAGVFITLAGHIAVMAPGTTIGAAHPVMGDGKNIEGDMRLKAENAAIAMIKSISEQRKRNTVWAEKSVKDSDSITDQVALNTGVIDLVAADINELLKQLKGKKLKVKNNEIILADYSNLRVEYYLPNLKQKVINTLANPNVAALLWLGATSGIGIELYSPGLILPGVVGVICLILALAVSQIIPISQGGVLLLVLGTLMIGSELFFPSFILGLGGIIAIILGSIYLIDVSQAPELSVNLNIFISIGLFFGALLFTVARAVVKVLSSKVTTGKEGLIGMTASSLENFADQGRISVKGEIWKACLVEQQGLVEKGDLLEIVAVEGLVLKIKRKVKI